MKFLVIGSIHRTNRSGERGEPWWTPTVIGKGSSVPTGQWLVLVTLV